MSSFKRDRSLLLRPSSLVFVFREEALRRTGSWMDIWRARGGKWRIGGVSDRSSTTNTFSVDSIVAFLISSSDPSPLSLLSAVGIGTGRMLSTGWDDAGLDLTLRGRSALSRLIFSRLASISSLTVCMCFAICSVIPGRYYILIVVGGYALHDRM